MTRLLTRLLGRLPVGWLQLTHSRTRLLAALAGVAFANVLVLVQLGLAGALNTTISQSYDVFDADIMISAADANTMTEGAHVARQWMFRALSDPEVRDAATLFVGNVIWTRASGDTTLQTYGIAPDKIGFLRPGIAERASSLRLTDSAILDWRTRGLEREELAAIRPQTPLRFETGGQTLTIRDTFEGGVSFAADGYMITSDQTFLRLSGNRDSGAPNHILLKLAPGSNAEEVVGRLHDILPTDLLRIRTLAEAAAQDQAFQATERPTGIIFGFGVVIGILVGVVIVYQVLSTDVADHLGEYATFKAMGYGNGFFLGIVIEEAMILALLGFVPGIAIASGLYATLGAATGLPIAMDASTAIAVLLGTIAACAVSGAIATRRLASADPADLF